MGPRALILNRNSPYYMANTSYNGSYENLIIDDGNIPQFSSRHRSEYDFLIVLGNLR